MINAKPTANHITIDSGDDENVKLPQDFLFISLDEAFTQFKESMDFHVSVKEAEKEKDRAIFMKKKFGQLGANASKDKEHDHTERTATPITIDLESESEDCVVIEASASDVPKRAAIRFRSDLCANDAKNKKKQSYVGCAANPITIGSDSESEDSVKIEEFLPLKRTSSLLDISNFGPKVLTSRKKSKTG